MIWIILALIVGYIGSTATAAWFIKINLVDEYSPPNSIIYASGGLILLAGPLATVVMMLGVLCWSVGWLVAQIFSLKEE